MPVRFYLTAFGPFPGVPVNPTMSVLQGVLAEVDKHPLPHAARIVADKVVDVAIEPVRAALTALRSGPLAAALAEDAEHSADNGKDRTTGPEDKPKGPSSRTGVGATGRRRSRSRSNSRSKSTGTGAAAASMPCDVFLHLGVHGGDEQFRLERTGQNCADFSVPDVSGTVASAQRINDAQDTSHVLLTSLPLPQIQSAVQQAVPEGARVIISDDAGRYLCNYMLYSSLWRCQGHPRQAALFLHTPKLRQVKLDIQIQVVLALLRVLADPATYAAPSAPEGVENQAG